MHIILWYLSFWNFDAWPFFYKLQHHCKYFFLHYSILIFMALKTSKTGSLPVSEIYSFMTEHFPYFKVLHNKSESAFQLNCASVCLFHDECGSFTWNLFLQSKACTLGWFVIYWGVNMQDLPQCWAKIAGFKDGVENAQHLYSGWVNADLDLQHYWTQN